MESFNAHFDTERRLTTKCRTVISFKLMDKRYLAKQLPKEFVELQKFANEYHNKELELRNPERLLIKILDIDIMDAWSNLPP